MERVLITGNLGYIGLVLSEELIKEDYEIFGIDTNYYRDRYLFDYKSNERVNQIEKDIRNINSDDLKGTDHIIHLAALSNDPLGELNPNLTNEINYEASYRFAKLAKKAGIKRFLFSSSCSIYGQTHNEQLTENDEMNPLSAYAHSKINFENSLSKLADDTFSPVYLRNGTAYGVSPNMRFDLVVNNLMGWAYTTKEIKILSDGRAWRPIVHIRDIANAFIASLKAPREVIHDQAFNVGINDENYQVKDIAIEINKQMSDCQIKILGKLNPDQRNYNVNFEKIKNNLTQFQPKWNIKRGIKELLETFNEINLTFDMFQDKNFTRIKQLKFLIDNNKIDKELYWL